MIPIFLLFFYTDFSSDGLYYNHCSPAPSKDQQIKYFEKNNRWFDSLNVHFVGNWPYGCPYAVASDTARNLIYFSCGGGVYIYDISNPSIPVKLSEKIHTRSRFAYDLYYDMATRRLYSAGGWNAKNEIWDISNPLDPIRLGGWDAQYFSWEIVVAGLYAYVADGEAGLRIVNISDPGHPYEVYYNNSIGSTQHIAVSDSFAYVIGDSLFIFNVSNPTNPYIVGHYNADGWIYVKDTLAYMTGPQFRILNVADPSYPYEIGHYGIPCSYLSIADSLAYLIYNLYDVDSLFILNISDPANLNIVGRCDNTMGQVNGMDMINSFLYTADSYQKIHIVDISNPVNPHEAGFLPTPGITNSAVISDTFAYIANDASGLRILNVSDLANPVEISYYDTPGQARWITVSDSHAYVADYSGNLRIIDISNPLIPYEIGHYDIPTNDVRHVAYRNPYAYVVSRQSGLRIINVADPMNPFEVGYYDTPGYATWVSLVDSIAYVSGYISVGSGYLSIINISDPSNLHEISYIQIPGTCIGNIVNGIYAYISSALDGIRIVDISDPANPFEVGYFTLPECYMSGIDLFNSYVYSTDYQSRYLRILNVFDPTNPNQIGYYETPDSPLGIKYNGVYAFVGDGFSGLQIYESYCNDLNEVINAPIFQPFQLLRNPINNGCINLKLQFNESGDWIFYLYNILGQEVKRYHLYKYRAGFHKINLRVSGLPPGAYFLRLQTRNHSIIKKILLIK